MVRKEILRHEEIGAVSTFVIDRALPAVKAVFIDGMTGTGFGTEPAAVTEVFGGGIRFKGRVGDDECPADERTVFRRKDMTA